MKSGTFSVAALLRIAVPMVLVIHVRASLSGESDMAARTPPLHGSALAPSELRMYQCSWQLSDDKILSASDLVQRQEQQQQQLVVVHPVDRIEHRDMSPDLFLHYLNSHRPFILTGAVEQWPAYTRWNLTYFLKHYGNYGSLFDWGADHGQLSLEDYQRKQAEDPRVYVAWTADSDNNDEVNTMMEGDIPGLPDAMPRRASTERLVGWVYSGLPSTGAAVHRDQVCEGTWTAQFKGEKQWCFSSHPRLNDGQQLFATTQKPGEMIVFTIPMWHGTHLLSESFSVHGYFPLSAADEFKDKLETLSRSDPSLLQDYELCFQHWPAPDSGDALPPFISDDYAWVAAIVSSCLALAVSCAFIRKLNRARHCKKEN